MSLRDDRTFFSKQAWIETDTGNRVSRKSTICGSQNIVLGGKTVIQPSTIIRGDLRRAGSGHAVAINIGKYSTLGEGCIVRPPYKTYKGTFSYYPVKIGDYVTIGSGSVVEAAQIGNMVEIGRNCVIGRFSVIKDCVKIEDNAVIPPGTTLPSMSVWAGSPAAWVEDLPESTPEIVEASSKKAYYDFQSA